MKRSKLLLLVLYLAFLHIVASGQSINVRSEVLQIGDKCPDFKFTNIVHWDRDSAKLSDFAGKLVILDFWATWCGPCVKGLPNLDLLQKKFSKDVIILPISRESKKTVQDFISQHTKLSQIDLPSVTELSLHKYFPHRALPHEVWIDQHGVVIAITGHEDVNALNISKALTKSLFGLKVKNDITGYNRNLPLTDGALVDKAFKPEDILHNSTITGFVEGSTSSVSPFWNTGTTVKFLCLNAPINHIYGALFRSYYSDQPRDKNPDFYMLMACRTVVESKKVALPVLPSIMTDETIKVYRAFPKKERMFCYESTVPINDSLMARTYVLNDLNTFFGMKFGIEGARERRRVQCWALTRVDTMKITSKSLKRMIFLSPSRDVLKINNYPLREYLWQCVFSLMHALDKPIIDESGLSDELVDLEIQGDLSKPMSVNRSLKKYGLQFKLVERDLDMIVIKDKI